MKKNDMVRDLPVFVDLIPTCHACQFGKQNIRPFPNSTWKASQKLQLIHIDVASKNTVTQGRSQDFNPPWAETKVE